MDNQRPNKAQNQLQITIDDVDIACNKEKNDNNSYESDVPNVTIFL